MGILGSRLYFIHVKPNPSVTLARDKLQQDTQKKNG